MKRRPVIERRAPNEAELRRRCAKRARITRHVREIVAAAIRDCDFAGPAELGREFIAVGAGIIAGSTDFAGAQSVLGVTSHRLAPSPAPDEPRSAAEALFNGGRR